MNENWFDKLDAYFNSELSDKEKSAFEAAMETDEELRTEVELYRDTVALLDASSKREIFDKVKGIYEDELSAKDKVVPLNKDRSTKQSFKALYRIAAIVLLAACAYLAYLQLMPQENDDLFADYFHTYEDVVTTMGTADTAVFWQGMQQYNLKNYKEAANSFNRVPESAENNVYAQLYLGICYIKLKRNNEASEVFQQLQVQKTMVSDIASWYEALAYLADGKKTEAIHQLEDHLSHSSSYKRESATKLLNSLK